MGYTQEDLTRIRQERAEHEKFIRFLYERANAWLDLTKEPQGEGYLTLDKSQLDNGLDPEGAVQFYTADGHFGTGETTGEHLIPYKFIFDEDGTYEQKVRTFLAMRAELGMADQPLRFIN